MCVSELPQRPSDAVRRPSSPCVCLAGTCWRQEHQSARRTLCPAGVLGEEGGRNCVDCLRVVCVSGGSYLCVCVVFMPLCMCVYGVYACVCGVYASVFVVFMPLCLWCLCLCVYVYDKMT